MKKLYFTLIVLLILSSTGLAAPQTDYSSGKVAVDISYMPDLDITGTDYGGPLKLDGKTDGLDFGITVGLNKNIGLQYINNNSKSDTYSYGSVHGNTKHKIEQLNILFPGRDNFSWFAGFTRGSADIHTSIGNVSGKNVNGYQVGVIEVMPVNDKLDSYGIVSFGNRITNAEFGLSQKISNNLSINVFYKYMKYKDLELDGVNGYNFDGKIKGIGIGATCKF